MGSLSVEKQTAEYPKLWVKAMTSCVASLICPLPRSGQHPRYPLWESAITNQVEEETSDSPWECLIPLTDHSLTPIRSSSVCYAKLTPRGIGNMSEAMPLHFSRSLSYRLHLGLSEVTPAPPLLPLVLLQAPFASCDPPAS